MFQTFWFVSLVGCWFPRWVLEILLLLGTCEVWYLALGSCRGRHDWGLWGRLARTTWAIPPRLRPLSAITRYRESSHWYSRYENNGYAWVRSIRSYDDTPAAGGEAEEWQWWLSFWPAGATDLWERQAEPVDQACLSFLAKHCILANLWPIRWHFTSLYVYVVSRR